MASKKKRKKHKGHINKKAASKLSFKNPKTGIQGLISRGKIREAIHAAKLHHKNADNRDSESLLVEAYSARISELSEKGLNVDAEALLQMVRKQYDLPQDRHHALRNLIDIRLGRLDDLVQPLNDPGASRQKRAAIEDTLKRELIDLDALAACKTLNRDHPLKAGALSAAKAFAALTSGIVESDAVALPEISRRSPLAPWKMLILAIACFYRYDDERCERYLQAIDPESAPARLVPVIRGMCTGESAAGSGDRSKSDDRLTDKITGGDRVLRRVLEALDSAFSGNTSRKTFKAIQEAVAACEQSCPELVDRLKQHISIRAWINEYDPEDIERALGGPTVKDAYLWRLFARAAESKGQNLFACALWDAFRQQALEEGWFPDPGKAVPVLYVHMADLLQRLPAEALEELRPAFKRQLNATDLYTLVPAPTPAKAAGKRRGADFYFLYPERLYRRAVEMDPFPETFQRWLAWVKKTEDHWKASDEVALAWHAAEPDNPAPLMHLVKSAESRNSLKKAIGYLDKAERANGLDPEVRKARLRLLTATAVRHLKSGKTHLVRKDIAAMEALSQATEGDRPAFLTALKCVCARRGGEKAQFERFSNDLAQQLNSSLAAVVVQSGLCAAAGISPGQGSNEAFRKENLPEGEKPASDIARACAICDDMGVSVSIPHVLRRRINNILSADGCTLDPSSLRTLAEAAFRDHDLELAYAASGVGLQRGGPLVARFLLLRARSLPARVHRRRSDCINAAVALGRRQRDMKLIDEAVELGRTGIGDPFSFGIFDDIPDAFENNMDETQINAVLRREKDAREYPSMNVRQDLDDADDKEDADNPCRDCDAENCPDRSAAYVPDPFAGDDDDDFTGPPEELIDLFMEMFAAHGRKRGRKSSRSWR